jgi:hypothetical protein
VAREESRPVLASLAGCVVEVIPRDVAAAIILKYEWLGTRGRSGRPLVS